jgi:hypothetical protein
MRDRPRRADGFYTVSGVLGIVAGPVLLLRGAPTGWSFLLLAAGLTLLAMQWVIVNDIEVDLSDRTCVVTAAAGIACIAIAVIYLTRSASDLPSLFPGHDGDSEHLRVVPGVTMLMIGLVGFGRALFAARPTRASH